MTPRAKTAAAPRPEAHLYLSKAEQFLTEASTAQAGARNDAAMLNAIHAAISATDAVCIALGGRRSTDPDHQRAVDLLEEIGGRSKDIAARARQLRALLGTKNSVEYESRQATAKEAAETVKRAERFVAWARQTIDAARL